MPSAPESFQLKIHLLGISPIVWRRVLVSSSTTLRELHGILHVAANVTPVQFRNVTLLFK